MRWVYLSDGRAFTMTDYRRMTDVQALPASAFEYVLDDATGKREAGKPSEPDVKKPKDE